MRKLATAVALFCGCSVGLVSVAQGQGRGGGSWSTAGGDTQLSGWQKAEPRLTRANVKQMKYLWKIKLGSQPVTQPSEPLFGGHTLGADGFKDMALVLGPGGTLSNVDFELGKLLWQRQLGDANAKPGAACSNGQLSAMVIQPPRSFTNPVARGAGGGSAGGGRGAAPAAAVVPAPAPVLPAFAAPRVGGNLITAGVFAELRGIFVVTGDGTLHEQALTNGWDYGTPVKFTPPGADLGSPKMVGTMIYATANGSCAPDSAGAYAMDMKTDAYDKVAYSGVSITGTDGGALSNDNKTLYVTTGSGSGDAHANGVVALDAATMQVKDYFTPSGADAKTNINISPVVFAYKGRDLVAAYVAGGRLALLDSASLGGPDHHAALAISAPISKDAGASSWGRLASAADSTGARFIYVSVRGALATGAKLPAGNGAVTSGAVIAFKVTDENGGVALTPVWVSPNIANPSPATIVMNTASLAAGGFGGAAAAAPATPPPAVEPGGLVFVLAQGGAAAHAKLYALDAETGTPVFTSGEELASSATMASLSLSGAHVLFLTSDNTLYSYGIEYEKN